MVSFYRALKFAWQGFIRNFWLSAATVLILVLTLFSVSLVGVVNFISDRAIDSVKAKVDISVYFFPEVPENTVQSVQAKLQTVAGVKEIRYIPKEEARANFEEKFKDDPIVQETLKILDENPLGATLVIQADEFNDYDGILQALSDPEYENVIDDKDFEDYQSIVKRLDALTRKVYQATLLISAIFVIIAILVVFNTIRITIYTHREEIGIMRLVGATNWFIRGPFILESLLYALISTALSLAVLFPFLQVISPQVASFFDGYNLQLSQYFSQYFLEIAGLQFIVALLLCVISSMIAIGRHLRA